ncbi:N-succinylarginine dihydrolase [Parablastomonas sp. CN1-191]|uniref:N-succinylarginine dihydrolase n=1 Tax=Parablastomonas sp. CN1-191 TaxID=3400908 RepID=UPI003BF78462
MIEINFDGLVGPSHNYAGLSLGNLAATRHAGEVSHPRAAALQGLAKMRHNLALGLAQGVFMPLDRPNTGFADALALGDGEPGLLAATWSASSMWTANAATVSPAADCADGRCHLSVANLVSMPHRSHEWPGTLAQLRLAFADPAFAVHGPVPPCFGDEGAANHMRLTGAHAAPGVEIFVYGRPGGPFPARQHEQAGRAIARRHGLDPAQTIFAEQAPEAIAAGAFHNDVVAVANETVLLCHERAFAEPEHVYAALRERLPEAQIVVVPESDVPLADAIAGYLFNAQLVTLPEGDMALVVPAECVATASIAGWLDRAVSGNGPIRRVFPVDVKESMANGGGPACLRLRVVADPATIDPRFLLDDRKADRIEAVVAERWPEAIAPQELGSAALARDVVAARRALLDVLDLGQLA